MNLEGLTASAFLDRFERFAKLEDDVAIVRLWFNEESPARQPVDLTRATFDALTLEQRTTIRNTGSGAGLVDTAHKSNA